MFHFDNDYRLKNEVVELIPLRADHEKGLYPPSNDEDIWKYFEEKGYGRIPFREYVKRALRKRVNKEEYPFVIRDLRTNELAGMTRIYAVNINLRNAKIGHTWIGRKFQGTGLNKNCKYLLFEFLFEKVGMERVGFGASSQNTRSIKAMESVGCVQEGRLRAFLPAVEATGRVDIVLLSVLKNEWINNVRKRLRRKIEAGSKKNTR